MAADALNRSFVEKIYELLVMANRSQLNGQAELFCFDIFRAFQSLRRQFKRPRDNERDRKSDYNCQHDQSHRPVRNFEERKNLRRNLTSSQPTTAYATATL